MTRFVVMGGAAIAAMALGPAPAAAAIHCGDEINEDTTLHKDLHCGPGTNGLNLEGGGITLDLNGHTISSDSEIDYALYVASTNSSTVKNGKVRGFGWGVLAGESTDIEIRGLDIRGAKVAGIEFDLANHMTAVGNEISGQPDNGVVARDATDQIAIKGNRLKGSGISVAGENTVVRSNSVEDVGGSTAGIALAPTAGETKVKDNTVERTTGGGIVTSSGAGPATMTGNTVLDVNFNGFLVAGGTDVVLRDNVAKGSQGGDGIHVEDTDTLIEDNRVINNDQHGIESQSANGSGNIAKHNGIHPQCMPQSLCGTG